MPGLGEGPDEGRYRVGPGADGGAGDLALTVLDLGLACCAVEFSAAVGARPDVFRAAGGADDADGARAEVLVVSGTVTDKMLPSVLRRYEQLPEPRYVVSFGSCANSGGPYWDSYCVTKGIDQVLPVDVYVPGCPPRPEALLHGLDVLRQRLEADAR